MRGAIIMDDEGGFRWEDHKDTIDGLWRELMLIIARDLPVGDYAAGEMAREFKWLVWC